MAHHEQFSQRIEDESDVVESESAKDGMGLNELDAAIEDLGQQGTLAEAEALIAEYNSQFQDPHAGKKGLNATVTIDWLPNRHFTIGGKAYGLQMVKDTPAVAGRQSVHLVEMSPAA